LYIVGYEATSGRSSGQVGSIQLLCYGIKRDAVSEKLKAEDDSTEVVYVRIIAKHY